MAGIVELQVVGIEVQDRHRRRVQALTAGEIETALRAKAIRAAGLQMEGFPHLAITFQRTLRIPDDGKTYPLPASLGTFPLRPIDDFSTTDSGSSTMRLHPLCFSLSAELPNHQQGRRAF